MLRLLLNMSFKNIYPPRGYVEYCAEKGKGFCFGQSWLWLSNVMTGAAQSLAPPDFHRGSIIHAEYLAQGAGGRYEAYLKRKVTALQTMHSSKCFQRHSAVNYASSVELVNALPVQSDGNAVVLMTWALHKNSSTLKRMLSWDDGAHSMVLLKLKHHENIYLFDPNFGTFEWVVSPGVELKTDVKRFMLANYPYGMAYLRDAMMLSTESDISVTV